MKKQLLTIRMLLVVAMLCLGVNVTWADPTTIYERGYTTAWSDADLADWVVDSDHGSTTKKDESGSITNVSSSIDSNRLKFNSFGNNSSTSEYPNPTTAKPYSFTKSITTQNNTILKLTADWAGGGATGTNSNTNHKFTFGDIVFYLYGSSGGAFIKIGSAEEIQIIANANNTSTYRNSVWHIELTVNQRTNAVRYSLSTSALNGGTPVTGSGTTASAGKFNGVVIELAGKMPNWSLAQTLNSIKITENTKATVTTEYVDESGNKLKADVVEEKDFSSSFTPTYDATINTEFKKYTYASGGGAATVTDDVTRSIVYNTAWQAAYADYTIHVAEDYEIESASVSNWSTSISGRYTPIISTADGNKFMTVNQNQRNNNGCTLTGALLKDKVNAETDFTLAFDIKLGSNTEKGGAFTINDKANSNAILKLTSTTGDIWKINDNTEQTVTMDDDAWYSVKLVRVSTTSYLTITKKSDSSEAFAEATITNLSETGGLGNMLFGTGRYNANIFMDNILVRDVEIGDLTLSTAPTISSTDNKTYVDGSLEITLACETAGASIRYTTDGTDPTSSSTLYSAPFDITETTTVKAIAIKDYAMSAVTSATYTKVYDLANVTGAETWDWSVVTSGNAYTQLTAETTPTNAEEFVLANTEYYKDGGYTIPAGFGDAQKLKVKCQYPFRYNSGGMFQGNVIKFTTTVPGKVEVYFSQTGSHEDEEAYRRYLYVNGTNTGVYSYTSSGDPETATVYVGAGEVTIDAYNSSNSAVMLRIYKIIFTPTKLNAKGYSTFSSSLNLQVTGADAYTAQLDTEKGEITCTKIADGKIPAGNGVLLYGAENAEVTFTVIESAPALENNDLKATTLADGSLATMGNNTYYVLSGDTFMQYNGNAFVAGKAYFDPSGTQARSLTMTFENEMTGIGNVQESKDSKADGCYNLAGQRVSNPTKGLYIMNGKKYIVK